MLSLLVLRHVSFQFTWLVQSIWRTINKIVGFCNLWLKLTKIILLLLLLVGVEWNNAYQIFRNTGTLLRKISNIWGMYLVVFCHWHNKRLYEVGIRYEYAMYQRSWTTLFHVAWPKRNFVTREHSKQQQPFIDSQTIDFIYI